MSCSKKNIRDGINQLERLSKMLQTDYIKIDERSQQDLIKFLSGLQTELAYYDADFQRNGDWKPMLDAINSIPIPTSLDTDDYPENIEPHLALYIVFARLYVYAQDELNRLTKKHLDFYYQDILGIRLKEPSPDTVNLTLELAKNKNLKYYKLDSGSKIDGGLDSNGNRLTYLTNQELIVSRAELVEQKTVFLDKKSNKTIVYAAPVSNSQDGLGTPFSGDNAFWATFGEPQVELPVESRSMIEADIGFAISSPMFILQEGLRKIDLTFHFLPIEDYVPGSTLQNSFKCSFTSSEGWLEPKIATTKLELMPTGYQLKVHVEIGVEQPPFTFFDHALHEDIYATQWPVLRFVLKPDSLGYDTLQPLRLDYLDIAVDVTGMKQLVVQNEQGTLDINKPFHPFGTQPSLNSNFFIGSAEVFQKKLNYLSLDLLWDHIPVEDFGTHYLGYGSSPSINNSSFITSVSMLLNRKWTKPLQASASIFDSVNAAHTRQLEMEQFDFNLATSELSYERKPTRSNITEFNLDLERGFIRLQLTAPNAPFKAFGHMEFPSLYTSQVIALAKYDPLSLDPVPILPNQPYTPKIKSLGVNYKSSEAVRFDKNNLHDTFFRIGPFGHSAMNTDNDTELVPQFLNQGELILGLASFEPPQTINFLFHLEEGSSDVDTILENNNINWSYLSNNEWIPLPDEEVLINNTQSFKVSGIISLSIPKDASADSTILPSGFIWVKSSVNENATGASKIRNIFTNAVQATLDLDQEDLSKYDQHLTQPLPADTIQKLIHPRVEIKKLLQPLPSFGGWPTETDSAFYTRVSERLRHKRRSVQIWDFERMVLEHFPNVFKAKCLTHTNSGDNSAAGNVTMLIISNLRNQNVANPFTPRTSKAVLKSIEKYLKNFVSPFVNIIAENPVYESILVEAKIGFHPEIDPGYYSTLLNDEIKQFLSPWAFENGKDIVIGGRIYKSAILQFIESRDYVDYVVDFKVYHIHDGPRQGGISEVEINLDFIVAETVTPAIEDMEIGLGFIVGEDVNIACATTSRSVLVSYPEHRIEALRPDEYLCPGASTLGIDFMTVNIDFIINK